MTTEESRIADCEFALCFAALQICRFADLLFAICLFTALQICRFADLLFALCLFQL
jgi:hypothetical protein